jgi:hypothetical protein
MSMQGLPTVRPRYLPLSGDHDVVAIRQEVRALARQVGLALSDQAKIATAISTIARALIAAHCSTTMRIGTNTRARRPALEIKCTLPAQQTPVDLVELEQMLHLREVRALVDEALLSLDGDSALLSLRMWLSSAS